MKAYHFCIQICPW